MTPDRDVPVWSIDFEFATTCGTGRPIPHTFACKELGSGQVIVLTGDQLRSIGKPPFDVRRSIVLAYNFVAEAMCFEALGWEQPHYPIDPYIEHRANLNGITADDIFDREREDRRIRFRLIDALRFYGIEVSEVEEIHKEEMQRRAAKGEPFTGEEWGAQKKYCADDVIKLGHLYLAMAEKIPFARAVVRGRYMTSIGQQMHRGVPIDRAGVESYLGRRIGIRSRVIAADPITSRVYRGGRFSESLLLDWSESEKVGLPRNAEGRPLLKSNVLRRLAEVEPRIISFANARADLAKLEATKIEIMADDRVRPNYWAFGTRTGRNRASASEYPLLDAKWIRGFVLAPPGRALAQLDFKGQELYVAAALSEDGALLEDLTGDPYLGFAKLCGLAPPDATKATHGEIRERFKPVLLGMVFGRDVPSIADGLGVDLGCASRVHRTFLDRYWKLCEWLDEVTDYALLRGHLDSPLGWPLTVGPKMKLNALRNHPIQTTGGDILHASCLYTQDINVGVVSTLHDSILIESDEDRIQDDASKTAVAMSHGAESTIGIPIPVEVEFTSRRYVLQGSHARFYERITGST
jgi:hypothetical protein